MNLWLLLGVCEGGYHAPQGVVPATRITGRAFPYILGITLKRKPRCTGALYRSNVVLTAAACIYGKTLRALAVVGSGTTPYTIRRMKIHEKYTPESSEFNMGLFLLANAMPESPLELDPGRIGVTVADSAILMGFGTNVTSPTLSQVAMYPFIFCSDLAAIKPYYEFCAGFPKHNHVIADYQEGSLVIVLQDETIYLAGLVARKLPLDDAPVLAARLSTFKPWRGDCQ